MTLDFTFQKRAKSGDFDLLGRPSTQHQSVAVDNCCSPGGEVQASDCHPSLGGQNLRGDVTGQNLFRSKKNTSSFGHHLPFLLQSLFKDMSALQVVVHYFSNQFVR